MGMVVVNAADLSRPALRDVPLRKVLERWLQVAEAADWKNLKDVRRSFPAADGVVVSRGNLEVVATVFNVKGNQYRLITIINYSAATVLVCDVLTHAEYSKQR